ncbi:MAG: 16S rRNA (guanine(527)-N(7))-methyltransferase RsmG [Bacilli bacterium]|nr:16S rRNA (guanine(527)-N(7))-methyltransferase RsmG [Bacilli bacterium]
MTIDKFIEELKKINIVLTDDQLEKFKKYADFLLEYNKTTNLTAIRDIEGVYLKHFYDSLLVFDNDIVDYSKVNSLIDIGTGAGFPGVVIKLMQPHINVTLLDSNNKKTTFLKELVKVLELENVTIVNDRAENFVKENRQKFDISIARAVSELRVISELCLPLTKVDGYFIALKGNYVDEIKLASLAINKLNSEIVSIQERQLPVEKSYRSIIYIKNNRKIDDMYPRRYEQIVKKALK